MNKFKSIIFGTDFIISTILFMILIFALPEYLSMKFMISYFNVVITVVSIIFSLLFTACAILLSSSDDDFIFFLNEDKIFDELLWTFKPELD